MRYAWRGPARTAVAAGLAIAFALTAVTASADVKSQRHCRGRIGGKLLGLARVGLSTADKCHLKANDKGDPSAPCNSVVTFDTKGKYAAAKTKALAAIDSRCADETQLLDDNYQGLGIPGAVIPLLEESVEGNTLLSLGQADLNGDKAKIRCVKGIAKARTKLIRKILKNAKSCQKDIDGQTAENGFGALDPSCKTDGGKALASATAVIQRTCEGLTGADVGSCDPLPTCVTDAAITVGQQMAMDFYNVPPSPVVCGDNVVGGSEQCDGDPNCNGMCEWTYGTCSPTLSGSRLVEVKISSPSSLAGVQVRLGYPIFTSSIPGVGNSSEVRSRVTVHPVGGDATMNDDDSDFRILLTSVSNFIPAGADVPLFDVSFDRCVALTEGVCNLNPNVTCQPNPPACAAGHFPVVGVHQPPYIVGTEIGPCDGTVDGPIGGCPDANDCIPQDEVFACQIAGPVDQDGNPVNGVTCSVTVTEMP
jgi:hypothetical protein